MAGRLCHQYGQGLLGRATGQGMQRAPSAGPVPPPLPIGGWVGAAIDAALAKVDLSTVGAVLPICTLY